MPHSQWKKTFTSWVKSIGMRLQENANQTDRCIAIYRVQHKKTRELYPLHAVVIEGNRIVFDILDGKNENLEYTHLVRTLHIKAA